VAVHFPDLALKYDDEPIVDSKGAQWRLSTDSHYNHVSRIHTMRSRLQKGDEIITGRFMVHADLLVGLEEDEDLRVLAVREIRKYLDRDELTSGFVRDLPYRFLA
jgi:hypothetical protein